MTATRVSEFAFPTEREREEARELYNRLAALPEDRAIRIRSGDRAGRLDVVLPDRVLEGLFELLRHSAEGNAVTVVPVRAELTTQQTANLLNISRPHLVKLLEGGLLPFHRAGRHRRVFAEDVFAYQARCQEEALEALRSLARHMGRDDFDY